jgi:UDP-glucose 4,6-dehydratase
LADVCKTNNLLLVNFATGCIFEYDKTHPLGTGIGFKEEDTPNFFGSYYSKTKAMVSAQMLSQAVPFALCTSLV